jgi:hypothetical protein
MFNIFSDNETGSLSYLIGIPVIDEEIFAAHSLQ